MEEPFGKGASLWDRLRPYLPSDRLEGMLAGRELPQRTRGAVLFADISGFTALTEALERSYGPRRGGEELTKHLNDVYGALVAEVHGARGSVIGFCGDAIMCWFDGDEGHRASRCAACLQRAMRRFRAIETPSGASLSLAIKVAVAAGAARRLVVGDPTLHVLDVLTGSPLDRVARAERLAKPGEIVVAQEVAEALGASARIGGWRSDAASDRFAVLQAVHDVAAPGSGHDAAAKRPHALDADALRPWLLPAVYERLAKSHGEYLAELRLVVALFLRFSGLDFDADEAAGEKLDAYVRWTQRVLARYEGALIQLTTGDKGSYLYASFGAPIAQENVTDRALSAALTLRSPPPGLGFIGPVQIGISSGRMRTGAYGSELRRTYGVLSDETNVAARLMERAARGQILVSARVAAEAAYRFEPLGDVELKGKRAMPVFELLGESGGGSVRRMKQANDAMVGRARERELLREALAALRDGGEAASIVLEGEPGIGKSRLVRDFIDESGAADGALRCIVTRTDPIERTTPYHAFRRVFRRLFEVEGLTNPLAIRARVLEKIPEQLAQMSPLLEAVLDVDLPETDMSHEFQGSARASALPQVLAAVFRALASGPLVLVVEDAHWLDSASVALLEGITRETPALLLVITTRPFDAPPPWQRLCERRSTRRIVLEGMPTDDIATLVASRLGAESLSPRVAKLVLGKAEGNPFFAEELALTLRDNGVVFVEDGVCHLARDVEELHVPDTIEGVVTSRIDSLPPSQQLALKVASVLGPVFSCDVLQEVFPVEDDRPFVHELVEGLAAVDLTRRDGPEAGSMYAFKHAVTVDVAYNLMLFEQRGSLHEIVADWYERHHADDLTAFAGLLAHHRYMAIAGNARASDDQRRRAVVALLRAGRTSLETGATPEAMEHATRGISVALALPPSRDRSALELDLRLIRSAALVVVRGPLDDEARRELSRARALSSDLGETERLFEALFGIWYSHLTSTERVGALEFSNQALAVARASGRAPLLLLAHQARGATAIHAGEFVEGLEHMRRAIDIADGSKQLVGSLSRARNPHALGYCYTAWASWFLGQPDRALRDSEAAVRLAMDVAHPLSVTQALCFAAQVRRFRRELAATVELAHRTHALATEHQFPYWLRAAEELLGWIALQNGDAAGARERLGAIAARDRRAGAFSLPNIVILTDLIEAAIRMRRFGEAVALVEEAKAAASVRLVGSFEAEIFRLEGRLWAERGDEAKADAAYVRAVDVARRQSARSLELRALTALTRLGGAKHDDAQERLAVLLASFDEGLGTLDLAEAHAALDAA